MFEAALGNSCRISIRARTARFNVSASEQHQLKAEPMHFSGRCGVVWCGAVRCISAGTLGGSKVWWAAVSPSVDSLEASPDSKIGRYVGQVLSAYL